jgi:plastocyanin
MRQVKSPIDIHNLQKKGGRGNMNNKMFFGLLILAAGILVGWFVFKDNPMLEEVPRSKDEQTVLPTSRLSPADGSESGSSLGNTQKGGIAARALVTYTDSGFAPQPLSVSVGSTVTFVNESSRGMWVASAAHPTHQLLPGFDQLKTAAKGEVYEYIFTKVGTWKYHNHVYPSDVGIVVVVK